MKYSDEEALRIIKLLIKRKRRSSPQNNKMWSLLGDISDQVEWYGEKLTAKDWKWVFTAAVRAQRMVPGIDGGLVFLGEPTSAMSKAEMSELIDCIIAFGVDHDVKWTLDSGDSIFGSPSLPEDPPLPPRPADAAPS